jgi:hypothetical protein
MERLRLAKEDIANLKGLIDFTIQLGLRALAVTPEYSSRAEAIWGWMSANRFQEQQK